tara:strand:- start:4207 stop:5523 length:1317 start_codon:yes stop_codon:yes gene_type:complete
MFFILTIFPISLVFPYQRHVRGLAAILATVAFIVLIFDAYVYANLGYHVGSASLDQAAELLRQQIVTNLRNFILIVVTVAALLLAVELTLSNFCWKKIERLKKSAIATPLFVLFIGSFMLSHLLHVYADANVKYDVTRQDNVLPLSYPATAKTFLARYQLIDLNKQSQIQLDKLSLPQQFSYQHNMVCQETTASRSTLLLVTDNFSPELVKHLASAGLRPLEQHFAPVSTDEALLNLLYSKFMIEQNAQQQLQTAPSWLAQLPEGRISISRSAETEVAQLPWLNVAAPAQYSIVFDNTPYQHWQSYSQFANIVVLGLSGSHKQFSLAPATVWSNWAALRQLQPHQVTQHLDWLPTLLAQAGCQSQTTWPGDNLLHPRVLPKLNISGGEIISFKKDKMVILRADGSYGVWSAGTLVPLNDRLDLPMLTDALKRIEQSTE